MAATIEKERQNSRTRLENRKNKQKSRDGQGLKTQKQPMEDPQTSHGSAIPWDVSADPSHETHERSPCRPASRTHGPTWLGPAGSPSHDVKKRSVSTARGPPAGRAARRLPPAVSGQSSIFRRPQFFFTLYNKVWQAFFPTFARRKRKNSLRYAEKPGNRRVARQSKNH